jgi:transcriptional regulator with XRE-family HTH domain
MSEAGPASHLGARLRQLRGQWGGGSPLTQRQVSEALGVSGALLSSWESGTAVPGEERLNAYARFFATRRSIAGPSAVLIRVEELTTDEERVRSALVDELVRLREEAMRGASPRPQTTGALGGRFWFFADGQPVTILCSPLSRRQLGYDPEAAEAARLPYAVQYATNPTHPNAVRNLGNGDIDALLELVGHVRAENPTSDVRWLTYDRINHPDQVTGHLVVLGGGDAAPLLLPSGNADVVKDLRDAMQIPVDTRFDEDDDEFGGQFVVAVNEDGEPVYGGVNEEIYRPRFLRDESLPDRPRVLARQVPQLASDVALIVRRPNPLNPAAKITILSGVFSRGTYGAVRTFTDVRFRSRNEQWLSKAIDPEDFWVLVQVPVFAGETVTPDLGRASQRLRVWSVAPS